jgi:hypothetical protein
LRQCSRKRPEARADFKSPFIWLQFSSVDNSFKGGTVDDKTLPHRLRWSDLVLQKQPANRPDRAKFERVKRQDSLLHPSSTPCAQVVKTAHATGFSQWLMTNLLSTEFIRRKILEGASPDAPNFSAVR